jgi:serine/threonine protein kinase
MTDNIDRSFNTSITNPVSPNNKPSETKTVQSHGTNYSNSIPKKTDIKPLAEIITNTVVEKSNHNFTQRTKDNINASIDQEGKVHVTQMYNKQGQKVDIEVFPEGKSHNILASLGNTDPRFNVEVKSKSAASEGEKSHADSSRAFLKQGSDIIEVDINELSNKLLINKEKLIKIINGLYEKNGVRFESLDQYINAHEVKFKNIAKIMNDYERICSNIGVQSYSATLMKVIKEFHKAGLEDEIKPKPNNITLKAKYKFEQNQILVDPNQNQVKVVAKKDKDSGIVKVTLLELNNLNVLGAGSFGTVYKVLQMDTNTLMALKAPHNDIGPQRLRKASKDIQNEYNLIKEIHANGIEVGIQKPMHAIYNMSNGGTAYVTDLYEKGNALSYIRSEEFKTLPLGSRLNLCLQLAKGEEALERHKIFNPDQKLENLLVDGNNVFIGDFGPAEHFNPADRRDPNDWIISDHYKPPNDLKTGVGFKTSVYHNGLMMYGLLVGKMPYTINSTNNWTVNIEESFDQESMRQLGYPEELINLVKAMCSHNSIDRPTNKTVLTTLDKIVNDHPELKDKLAAVPQAAQPVNQNKVDIAQNKVNIEHNKDTVAQPVDEPSSGVLSSAPGSPEGTIPPEPGYPPEPKSSGVISSSPGTPEPKSSGMISSGPASAESMISSRPETPI